VVQQVFAPPLSVVEPALWAALASSSSAVAFAFVPLVELASVVAVESAPLAPVAVAFAFAPVLF
jgi:hypothetical protein